MSVDIDVSELNKLAFDFGRAPAKVVAKASLVVRKSSADIERDSKLFAPVDTGNLRNGISYTVIGLIGEIGPTADYAPYVENGTSVMAPQAFMGPAFDRNVPGFISALEIIATEALD